VGALDLRLGLVPLIAVLVTSCDGDGVAFDVRVPVDPPVRPLPELAFWRSSGGIAIARTDRTGTVRSRNLGLGDVRRFFVDRVAWSPDGRRLAFTGEAGLGYRQRDIWTVDGDGGRLRRAIATGRSTTAISRALPRSST
jgi:hypothetical protein